MPRIYNSLCEFDRGHGMFWNNIFDTYENSCHHFMVSLCYLDFILLLFITLLLGIRLSYLDGANCWKKFSCATVDRGLQQQAVVYNCEIVQDIINSTGLQKKQRVKENMSFKHSESTCELWLSFWQCSKSVTYTALL